MRIRYEEDGKKTRLTDLNDWDVERDESYINSLIRGAQLAEDERLAVEAALKAHPVTPFVLGLPFERSDSYPAISEKHILKFHSGLLGKKLRVPRRALSQEVPFLHWSLPGRDARKDDRTSCGVYRSNAGSVSVIACTKNRTDFMKAVSTHCWSLACPHCMNSTALRKAVEIERKIIAPVDIASRKSGHEEKFKHWVISPPQEWFKRIMQRADHFQIVYKEIMKIVEFYGVKGGVMLFHPWRLEEDRSGWSLGPHFHIIGYGRFDNMSLRRDLAELDSVYGIWGEDGKHESWVVKQIHPESNLRSIRHTVAYVLTHVGLGTFENHRDLNFLHEHVFVPLERDSHDEVVVRPFPPVLRGWENGEGDRNDWSGIYSRDGLSVGVFSPGTDIDFFDNFIVTYDSSFDYVDITEDYFLGRMRSVRYFGSSTKVRNFEVFEERKVRKCPDCGSDLGRFASVHACGFEPASYIHRSPIRVMRDDFDAVSSFWKENCESFGKDGLTVLEFAMSVPQCSTPETAGLQVYDPLETVEERKVRKGKKFMYLWSESGLGLDPVFVTAEEEKALRQLGRVADVDDPAVRSFNSGKCVWRDPCKI